MSLSSSLPLPSSEVTPFLSREEVVRAGGKFRLKLVRATWGIEGNLFDFFRKAIKDGKPYEAFEAPWGLLSEEQRDQLLQVRKELGLEWSALVFTDRTGLLKTVDEHFSRWVEEIELVTPLNPIAINSHSGLDSWNFEQSLEFFKKTIQYQKEKIPHIPIYHETHRGRALYNPWTTRDLVIALPDLLLTADYSHWVNVCERLIDSEQDVLTLIAPRVRHIHARVGFENGPQVTDPRAPEWAPHVRAHEKWWEEIFKTREAQGDQVITLVPEYGPGDAFCTYMHMLPFTQVPVANLNDIVDWTAARMQHKFKQENKL